MIAPDLTKELVIAANDALKWLGKAIADDAFANCVNPKSGKAAFDRLDRAVKAAKAAALHVEGVPDTTVSIGTKWTTSDGRTWEVLEIKPFGKAEVRSGHCFGQVRLCDIRAAIAASKAGGAA